MTDSPAAAQHHSRRNPWPWIFSVAMIAGFGIWWLSTAAPKDQGGVVRSVWLEELDAARGKARTDGKLILVNFTGSDWCGYCIRMRDEIFDTGIFANWAKDHVVLLECDFPPNRRLAAPIAQQNEHLADRYGISGFPTILLIDQEGRELARSGYRRGGAAIWIADLERQISRGTVPPQAQPEIR